MADWLNVLTSAVPWPFPQRPSLENLGDPDVRQVLAVTFSELGLAVLVMTIACVARRGLIVAVLVALSVIFLQGPNLGLLFVEATPTSYRETPTGFSAASIAAGRRVFAANCVSCHGEAGDGVGGLGSAANLHLPHIWIHPVGDLFWFVSHGIAAHDDVPAMPAWEGTLPEASRWSAIDYVYALNAGAVTRGLEGWPHRVPAPEVSLSCATLPARSIAGLRGKAVRVILGAPPEPLAALPPVNGIDVVTLWIPGEATEAAPTQGVDHGVSNGVAQGVDCVAASDPDAAKAYAILAGAADGHLIPARILIDPDGVLRSVWRKEDGAPWADPERLVEEMWTICTEPLTFGPGGEHEHHH